MIAALVLSILSGCGRQPAKQPSSPPGQGIDVDLTAKQLASIRIETARDYSFPVLVQAVGNVSFTDDPGLVQAESTLLGAAATYTLTQKELARVQSLGTTNGIAEKDLEQAVSDAQTATAAYKAARDALRALGKSDADISRLVASGKLETRSSALRAIKWVNASVSESDSALVRVGQPMAVVVAALPARKIEGTVSEIYSTVDPVSHRVTVRAKISDPGDELRPGMLVDIALEVRKPIRSVGVPENAVVREGDGTMTAWVTSDHRHFRQRVVSTGLREDGRVQILNGLKEGEQVVTDGAIFLDNVLNAPPGD